ncbi:MAG: hypothetical protein LC649_03925 [Bacteroidales bacterium]|nr:hypothetical protein [Bacteroidales bacterium]
MANRFYTYYQISKEKYETLDAAGGYQGRAQGKKAEYERLGGIVRRR